MTPKPSPEPKLGSLPDIADLEPLIQEQVKKLLLSLEVVSQKKVRLLVQEDELKDQLEALQKAANRPGFRFEGLVYTAAPVAGRKTLDKLLLMENGVSAQVISDSMKVGKPSTRVTFKRLTEEDV